MKADHPRDAPRPPASFMAGVPAIGTVAVIGAGQHGRSFALRCAQAGFQTILEDVMPAKLQKAREALDSLSAHADMTSSRLRFALTVEDAVREADLAIDFVPDELESKLEIFSLIDRMAPPKTILCTPTETLSISDLASCTYRGDRCLALRSVQPRQGNSLQGDLWLTPASRVSKGLAESVQAWLQCMGFVVRYGEDLTQA